MVEKWKLVPSQPGYEVSDLGRVRSIDRDVVCTSRKTGRSHLRRFKGKLLRPGKTSSGHFTVACGKGNSRYVHDLVLESFIGPKPQGMECLHEGDVGHDNRLNRLRYGTRSENVTEMWENGGRA